VLFCVSTGTFAQESADFEQQVETLQDHLKNDYFSFGLLLQSQADFQPERVSGHNGFSSSLARFKIGGTFNNKFGYKLQASMLKAPSVVDANVYYKPSAQVELKAGLFKSPFTHEYATGAGSVLFANRATAVNELGIKRQLGLQLDTYTSENIFRFTAGVFNGNGYSTGNDDNNFLYMGRVESYLGSGSSQTKLGVGLAHESKNVQADFVGQQTHLTTYASTTQGKLLLDGEFIHGWSNPDVGADSNPYGYYVTAGYFVTNSSRLLLRWDAFEGDNLAQDSEHILVGFNHSPNQFTKLKLTYSLPTDDSIDYSHFFASLQVGF
jgi:phosphate-selective porin